MKYLGIDYGSKRIGIALSDESNTFAIPYKVVQNSKSFIDDLNEIICKENATHIVMGESKNYQQQDNSIMKAARQCKEDIENRLSLPVVFEPEFLTSHQAEYFQGKHDMLDASAAALILQSYLDRIKNN